MTSSPAWRWPFSAVLIAGSIACSSQLGEGSQQQPPPRAEQRQPTIQHVSPPRDSVGAAPKRLVWSAVEGADQYTVGIWNEVDVRVWQANGVHGTSVDLPADVRLEPGTYFWSVGAARKGQPLATSGLAAFVVRTADR